MAASVIRKILLLETNYKHKNIICSRLKNVGCWCKQQKMQVTNLKHIQITMKQTVYSKFVVCCWVVLWNLVNRKWLKRQSCECLTKRWILPQHAWPAEEYVFLTQSIHFLSSPFSSCASIQLRVDYWKRKEHPVLLYRQKIQPHHCILCWKCVFT